MVNLIHLPKPSSGHFETLEMLAIPPQHLRSPSSVGLRCFQCSCYVACREKIRVRVAGSLSIVLASRSSRDEVAANGRPWRPCLSKDLVLGGAHLGCPEIPSRGGHWMKTATMFAEYIYTSIIYIYMFDFDLEMNASAACT